MMFITFCRWRAMGAGESYASFFREQARVEQETVDSLLKPIARSQDPEFINLLLERVAIHRTNAYFYTERTKYLESIN